MEDSNTIKRSGTEALRINWNAANTYAYQVGGMVVETNNENKLEEFKERIKPFNDVSTLEEAKALAEKILPVKMNINIFKIGSAECIIINKPDMFRISINSDKEFICYDFV